MAKRRMFSLDVVDTDSFLDLPASSQSLYFHLGMRADDDGFVSSPKRITAMVGAAGDDLKLLIAKGFAQVVRIRDKKARGKTLEKDEREWYRRNSDLVNIKNKLSQEEETTISTWLKLGKE